MAEATSPETKQIQNPYQRLLDDGYLRIGGAIPTQECETLRRWLYQRSELFIPERCQSARARRRGVEKQHYHAYQGRIGPDSLLAKAGNSVESALRYELPRVAHTDDGEPCMTPSFEFNTLRVLRIESSDAPWEPRLIENALLAIAYLCVQSRLIFRVQRSVGQVSVDVPVDCGDIVLILTSGYPGEDVTRSVRHSWHTPSDRVYLLECRK
jgi:hypothetical protein